MPKAPKIRERLTYANVMSTLCFFLLLSGGAAYAASQLSKNSVGNKQLRKNAVTTAKIKNEAVTASKVKNGTLTGAQIHASTIGTVPSASNAEHLGGAAASSFRDACPPATTRVAPDLCATTSDSQFGEVEFERGLMDCAGIGMRLPSPGEAFSLLSVTSPEVGYWTDDFWVKASGEALYYTHDPVTFTKGVLIGADSEGKAHVRCVTGPTNS